MKNVIIKKDKKKMKMEFKRTIAQLQKVEATFQIIVRNTVHIIRDQKCQFSGVL